jgi:hypothetical protein
MATVDGAALATAAADALAATLGAADELEPPQAVAKMATTPARTTRARGPDRERFILDLLLVVTIDFELPWIGT